MTQPDSGTRRSPTFRHTTILEQGGNSRGNYRTQKLSDGTAAAIWKHIVLLESALNSSTSTSIDAARSAGLHYVNDSAPGMYRRRRGRGFSYVDCNGELVHDASILRRIASLAIPPAWKHVWICALENGHIQATGLDERGRKQYRYHDHWREVRDLAKYDHLLEFGLVLPDLRKRVTSDLHHPGLSRKRVLATIVELLDQTRIRIGNESYAVENKSFGLTTLRSRHARLNGPEICLRFRGKSGVEHCVSIRNRRIAAVVKRCQELPGQQLFQYLDANGTRQVIESGDVNEYLRHATGAEITAKEFRTWWGTVITAETLATVGPAADQRAIKRNVIEAVKHTARELGNTPTACRRCYVHPIIPAAYERGRTIDLSTRSEGLSPPEAGVLDLLNRPARNPIR